MPSARVHEVIAKKINKDYNYNEKLLRIGTIAPDCWRNVSSESGFKDKYLSHFWDFRIKNGQANDYEGFYIKYYKDINNPFYFGYLLHLIVDQYWKNNINTRYEKIIDGEIYLLDNNGNLIKDENYYGYYERIKMQQRLASKYNLDKLPIKQEEYDDFICEISEVNLNGLFNENGTIDYANNYLFMSDEVEESLIYDDESVENNINETAEFVKEELVRLNKVKQENNLQYKIAVDIDDTILSTKELEDKYWEIFLNDHPEIDITKEMEWGNEKIALFWDEHRENMAYGEVKNRVSDAFEEIIKDGFIIDLLSARPAEKYASLNKKLTDYLASKNIVYNRMYLSFYSKVEFLKEHGYDLLIDNELRHIESANNAGISTILYGPFDSNYIGIQTDDWGKIPKLVREIKRKEGGFNASEK